MSKSIYYRQNEERAIKLAKQALVLTEGNDLLARMALRTALQLIHSGEVKYESEPAKPAKRAKRAKRSKRGAAADGRDGENK